MIKKNVFVNNISDNNYVQSVSVLLSHDVKTQ